MTRDELFQALLFLHHPTDEMIERIADGGIELPGGARLMVVEPAIDDEGFWTHEGRDDRFTWYTVGEIIEGSRSEHHHALFRQVTPEEA